MLIVLYLITWILTEFLTNNAVAVITFPFAIFLAASTSTDFMPYVMVIMFAASASFATPIGYQTNLMVYGTGGYKLSEFLQIGIPLNLIISLITIFLVPIIWPFYYIYQSHLSSFKDILALARHAGVKILEFYDEPIQVHSRSEQSPPTLADLTAHRGI